MMMMMIKSSERYLSVAACARPFKRELS